MVGRAWGSWKNLVPRKLWCVLESRRSQCKRAYNPISVEIFLNKVWSLRPPLKQITGAKIHHYVNALSNEMLQSKFETGLKSDIESLMLEGILGTKYSIRFDGFEKSSRLSTTGLWIQLQCKRRSLLLWLSRRRPREDTLRTGCIRQALRRIISGPLQYIAKWFWG